MKLKNESFISNMWWLWSLVCVFETVECVGFVSFCAFLTEAGHGSLVAGAPESVKLQIIFIKLCIKTPVVSPQAARLLLLLLVVVSAPSFVTFSRLMFAISGLLISMSALTCVSLSTSSACSCLTAPAPKPPLCPASTLSSLVLKTSAPLNCQTPLHHCSHCPTCHVRQTTLYSSVCTSLQQLPQVPFPLNFTINLIVIAPVLVSAFGSCL